MNKKIIFSLLLITNTISYGMKRERQLPNIFLDNDLNTAMVLFNPDLLPQITTGICSNHRYWPRKIRKDIGALSTTNKFFNNYYYAQEKIQQDIIQLCSQHRKLSSRDIARDLKFRTTHTTINHFTHIAHNEHLQFTEDDLKKTWYLNVSTTVWNGYLRKNFRQPLIQVALKHSNPEKVMQIITHAQQLDFCHAGNANLLTTIADRRRDNRSNTKLYAALLEIAQHLLKKGLIVEYRESDEIRTPLMKAVSYKDDELTELLLKWHSNPYTEYCNPFTLEKSNAFAFEPEEGWLQKIIDKVEAQKIITPKNSI